MNKKVLIRLGILALGILILALWLSGDRNKSPEPTAVPLGTLNTTKKESISEANVKDVFLMVDPSGSMKGYLDFAGFPEARKTLVNTITKPLDRLSSDYAASLKVKYGTAGNYTVTTTKDVQDKMTTGAAFNGAVTMLDLMIADAVKQVTDSSVSMLVSDMVLSYGRSKLISSKDYWLNTHNLSDLGSSIHTVLKSNTDVKVLLLQYYSDFNGKYYYNCTENLENGDKYRQELMKYRPYYIMVFGNKEMLKSLLDNGVFVSYENVYASFDLDDGDKIDSEMYVVLDPESVWIPEESTSTIYTTVNNGSVRESLEVQFKKFDIPAFLNQKYEIGDYHLSDVIESIDDVTDSGNPEQLRFRVTLKPYDKLPGKGKVEFTLVSGNTWAADASIEDDAKIDTVSVLEKKTWGFETIVKNIDDAYFPNAKRGNQAVASISFNIEKR